VTAVPPSGDAAGARGLADALIEEAHRAESAGRRELARQRYESALYLLRDPSQAALASTILRRVGRTYLDDGDVATGLDCLTAAQAVAEASENASEVAHTMNVMAISYWQRGLLDEARALYEDAGRMARVAGDDRLVAMVEQNMGVISSMRGDESTALAHHIRSLEQYRALGMREQLGRQLSNIGLAYSVLGRVDEARRAYDEAFAVASACGDHWTRLMVEVNGVALLVSERRFEEARKTCDRLLTEAGALHETRIVAETHKHLGVIARETGRLEESEGYLQSAYEQAMAREDLSLAAETAREQAELFLALGRNRDTLQALSLSHRLFTQLRARRELADVTRKLHELEDRFQDLVRQWAQSIESKDRYTLGHCERVARYACTVATDLGFDDTTLFWFRVGALLHDVGKIVVPSDILNKAGPLTPDERAIMERHPTAGVELLRDVDFPWDVLPMIRGHHERWDGHGYPDGLAGESIPLAARILCVADVYDALTTDRPYRPAFDSGHALRLMSADSGRQFDPDILARFLLAADRIEKAGEAPIPVYMPPARVSGPYASRELLS
jgi:putative nucleotidyltransferase with HDIG domain